jgi:hypothetical protein
MSATYDAVQGAVPAPASRLAVFATMSMIVGVLTAIVPLMNPEIEPRTMLVNGVLPGWVAARLWWAERTGAIRERIIRPDRRRLNLGWDFSLAVINPDVLTRAHEPARFRNYMRFEMALATIIWMMMVLPAFMPLLQQLGALLGPSGD